MKHNRKWLALLLAGCLLGASTVGCGKKQTGTTLNDEDSGLVVVEDVTLNLEDDAKLVDKNRDRTRITYEYDYYGNITKAVYQDLWNGGDPKVVFEAEIEYNEKGRPTRVNAPVGYYYLYEYDQRDQLTNVKVYWDAVVSDPKDDYIVLEYNRTEKGECPYTVTEYNKEGGCDSVTYYNQQLQRVKKHLFNGENEHHLTITYEYNAKGHLISQKQEGVFNSDFEYHQTYADSDYDRFGNCYVKWQWNTQKVDRSHLYAYFDLDGGVTQLRIYLEEHNTYAFDLYEYDADGRLMKFQDYTMGGYAESIYHPYTVWGDGLMNLFLKTRPDAQLNLTGEY